MRTAKFWSVSVLLILLSPMALKAQEKREKAAADRQEELVELRQLVSQLSNRLVNLDLRGLTNLVILDCSNTQVTDKGVDKLQQALPDCFRIRH